MLDMGFIRDIRRILDLLPARRQNLLFSATFSDEIRELAGGLLDRPAEVQIARRNAPIELVRQVVYPVDRERKRELLSHLITSGRIDRALVFTRTKHGANRLAEQLVYDGILASAIHGNKSQGQRVRALDDFKSGRVAILVATEVASRGLDIDGLPHVVNFELPMVAQDYVHRIGRTGRAGLEGDAVSLVCIDENMLLDDIQALLRQPIRREVVPGFEVNRSIPREPIRQRSNGAGRPMAGRRPNGVRQAAPIRVAETRRPDPNGFRQPAPTGYRQPAPGGFRQPAPGGYRQPAPTGFNQSVPVEPRRASASPGGFRRPVPSDFQQAGRTGPRPAAPGGFRQPASGGPRPAAPTGIGAAHRSSGYTESPPRHGGRSRPAQAPANRATSARPATGGYRQGDRRTASPQGDRPTGHSSLPGERIARFGNRAD
jgi:ATP-dependent RNA helicase RhlE